MSNNDKKIVDKKVKKVKKVLPGITEAPKEHPDNKTGNMKIIME